MPDSPLISVIVPVYNVEKYLRKCLDSICGQTYHHLEILCINDGSTDGSAAILEEYAAKDTRIKVFTQPNAGLSAARNTGLDHATGEWIAGVDSDDYLEPDAIEYALSAASDEVDIISFGVKVIWENMAQEDDVARTFATAVVGRQQPDISFLLKNTVTFWNKLWRRSFVEQYQARFPVGLWYEDNYFWWALAPYARCICSLPEKKINYVRRPGSIMSQTAQGTPRRLGFMKMANMLQAQYDKYSLPHSLSYTRIAVFIYLYQSAQYNLPQEHLQHLRQEAYRITQQYKLFKQHPLHLQFLRPTPWYLRPLVKYKPGKVSFGLPGLKLVTIQSRFGMEITRFLGIKIRKTPL